jgi:hypothetical protein
MNYQLEKDDFNNQIAELKRMKKDNDPHLMAMYQDLLAKYGEPERVAYDMRMDSIYEEAKDHDHLLVRSNSSSSDPKDNNSLLLAAPENLVLIQSK